MDPEAVFKRYDIRGTYKKEIDAEFAKRLSHSVSKVLRQNLEKEKIIVGRDNKQSSKRIKKAFEQGIKQTCTQPIDAGVGPTDLTAYTGMQQDTPSIHITASHMPLDYTGFKLMYSEGNAFTNKHLDMIEKHFYRHSPANTENKNMAEPKAEHKNSYFHQIKDRVEQQCGVSTKKIVFDHLGGATKHTIPRILEMLGHDIKQVDRSQPESPPDPKPSNLKRLKHLVDETDADLGIASDMDGDRFKAYYNGRFLSGDKIMCMLATTGIQNITASIDTSERIRKEAEDVSFTRVGDPFVMDEAISNNSSLAGEANGHFSLTNLVPYPSGTVTSALIASMNLKKAVKNTENFHVERQNIHVSHKKQKMKSVKKAVESRYNVKSRIDGIKYVSDEATVLIRSSGSEALLRVKADADTKEKAVQKANEARNLIRNS